MKKLSILALITGLISPVLLGQVATPPVIDGDGSDAVWATVPAWDLLRQNLYLSDFIDGADDFSATIKTIWGTDAVYCLLEVKDDTLDTQSNQAWERDHWSIYFDMSNLKQNGDLLDDKAEPMDSVQFMLEKVWSVEGDINLGLAINRDTLKWGVDFVETIDSGTSYLLEIAVPFSDIGVTLAEGMTIGFDAKVGDNDGDGQLDGKLALYQTADEGWHNMSYIGTAMLEADGSLSRVEQTPVIDGVWDPAWYNAKSYNLTVENLYLEDFVDNAADFSGSFRVMHDYDNIYVLLDVKDDTLDTQSNQAWERDHWSVYFDISNIKQNGALLDDKAEPMDSVQFMLEKVWSVEGDIDLGLAINKDTLKWGVDFAEVIDSGSHYMVEIAVPFSRIGVTLTDDMVIGYDTKIGDNDGDGQLDAKLSWHQSADEGWHNAAYLGNMSIDPAFFDLGPLSKAPAQVEVDGVKDGDWTHAITMPLERQNLYQNVDNAADFSGTVKALWDPDNFYVLLEVKDDILETQANNAWERDHWSVYFDINNIKQDGDLLDDKAEPMDSVQFMLEKIWSVEGDIPLGLAINKDTLKWGVDFVEVIDTGTSYLLELVVPFHRIGVTLNENMIIGWDAKIGDNDGAGQLDAKLSWNQLADEGWHNASYLGEVQLMPNGTIFGTPVEEITTADVTFNVDMNGMIAAEIFDPATDNVDLAGSFNNWGDPVMNATDDDSDGIYTIVIAEQEFGTEMQFKFRVNGQWDPISEFPGGGPNRTYTVVEGENIVNVVFNDGDYSPWIESVEQDEASHLQIYPNPAKDALHIFSRSEIRSVSITNLVGQSVLNVPVNRAVTSIDISTLDRGVYIVSVQFESQVVTNSVFIKQ